MVKVILQVYPVIPAGGEDERQPLRPLGRGCRAIPADRAGNSPTREGLRGARAVGGGDDRAPLSLRRIRGWTGARRPECLHCRVYRADPYRPARLRDERGQPHPGRRGNGHLGPPPGRDGAFCGRSGARLPGSPDQHSRSTLRDAGRPTPPAVRARERLAEMGHDRLQQDRADDDAKPSDLRRKTSTSSRRRG